MKRNRTVRRRATVLIMVVTLLALLFVIVSGYLTLARFDRQTLIIAQQGNTADEIVDGVNNLVLSLVREQWLDDSGEVFGGPDADPEQWTYEDAYSYGDRDTYWLAPLDPVFDPTAVTSSPLPYRELEQVRWPAVSSFAPVDRPIQSSIRALMLKQNDSALNMVEPLTAADARRNARLGFMDADGDGVPDAGLLASATATELANTMSGTSVRLRGMQLHNVYGASAIPADGHTGTAVDDLWRRYDNLARYEVAVRVVPHGGMVSLGLPNRTASDQWNHTFAQRMFTWLGRGKQGVGPPPDSQFLGQLFAEAAAVEPALRRRGGLLPSYRPQGEEARVPDLLRRLEEDNWGIFAPTVNGEVPWQRFNLGTIGQTGGMDEWALWSDRAFLNAYRLKQDPGNMTLLGNYDRRHLITTVSYSDELARKQEGFRYGVIGAVGTRQGQTKFYLGDVEQCFDPSTGQFVDTPQTRAVIRRLAGVFYDMLAGHAGWADDPNSTEAVTRQEQALMLAVNTVAFTAPRSAAGVPGFIDVVSYLWGGKTYIGYGPQPFITQVMVSDDDPNQGDQDLALGVELYNPHDPTESDLDRDDHALNLGQYCITLNNTNPNLNPGLAGVLSDLYLLMPGRMHGRTFVAFGFRGSGDGNTDFDNIPNGNGKIVIPHPNFHVRFLDGSITVRLWRQSSVGEWYLVDELELEEPTSEPGGDWWRTVYRDTQDEAYLGDYAGLLPARWRMGVNFPASAGNQTPPMTGPLDVTELGLPGPQPTGTTRGPTVPLYTMNASPGPPYTPLHGTLRPNSFPTVGFLLFVPRFSHIYNPNPDPNEADWKAMSLLLEEQWNTPPGYSFPAYPADFGHMPVFDNTQNDSGDYFDDDEAGRIPWGLLVFDYFTTLDPDGLDGVPNTSDDRDPYRVPGRININAAPWFVLAGLPVVSPYSSPFPPSDLDGDGALDLPLHVSASPAFRLTGSGILAGLGVGLDGAPNTPDDVPRSLVYWTSANPTPLIYDGWWHLGTDLALAAAEYRDRIPYLHPWDANTVYKGSAQRNPAEDGLLPPIRYRNRQRYGEIRQGDTLDPDEDGPRKYGFLSLGELANVKGFDSLTYDPDTDYRQPLLEPLAQPATNPAGGDFMRAVSLLALLDTHFLTTRSNTFTAYVSVRDRRNPQQSVRSQITVDRSNILPRLVLDANGNPIIEDPDGAGPQPRQAVVITKDGLPEVIAERRVGYYNARFDD